ncbi:MAG: exodeoxyribonuclease VII large subunit, partial [candidate division Zixibacteria bacterium]|nr:exodeoxyribonuclease VII large subunit [candidate division Zixibacteria bacterium]
SSVWAHQKRFPRDSKTITMPSMDSELRLEKIHSVTEITGEIKATLEAEYQSIWVEGEISNYLHHSSGHRYFTLKDTGAQIKAVIWRFSAQGLHFEPKDGLKVRVFGDITLYEKGGYYQIRITRILPVGKGSLEEQFQRLKEKLALEGLFSEDHKQPIPAYPSAIGIISSPTGAAIRDIMNICHRRAPTVRLILRPARVQGDGAAQDIAQAIEEFNRWGEADVLIVGRGGGSLEDLWAFNEEIVARAIYQSQIPIISAVGHEIDFSIADFVADLRAATPSAAAELATYDAQATIMSIDDFRTRLARALTHNVEKRRQLLGRLISARGLLSPAALLERPSQRLDDNITRMKNIAELLLLKNRGALSLLEHKLNALSPDNVLKRGYAVVQRREGLAIVKLAAELSNGDRIDIKFADGSKPATIE